MSDEANGLPEPPADPSALKSILNPIQSEVATPSSVVPEPARSPQPDPAAPIENGIPPIDNQPPAPAVTNGNGTENGFDSALPPLPIDAPVPPSPKAADEPPPELPAGAIPPAVSTPSVITDGMATPGFEVPPPALAEVAPTPVLPVPSIVTEPAAELQSVTPAPEISKTPAVASAPTADPISASPALEPVSSVPSGVVEPAPTPSQATPTPAAAPSGPVQPTSDGMDVDQPVSSPSSLKRPGEELEGGDGKRSRDDGSVVVQSSAVAPPAQSEPPAPPASVGATPALTAPQPAAPSAPLAPEAAPAIGVVPIAIPPAPVASGPSTPFTLTQHKHMLNSVRGLKKNKDGVFFLEPVDPIKFNIPAYPTIITNPMDLSTVETKLIVSDPRGPPKDKSKMGKWDESKGRYNSVAEVTLDVRQIFWNTARFNGPDHLVTQAAKKLDVVFTKMVNNMPPEVSPSGSCRNLVD